MQSENQAAEAKDLIRFNLSKWQNHDMSTFWGRYLHWHDVVAPHRSFYTSSSITQYNRDVKALVSEKGDKDGFAMLKKEEIDEYKYKKTVLASCMSPDTEEPIMWPSRISAFIPTNLPIFAGMLISAQTTRNIVFWQWLNQTYNAGLNFGNRNASSPQTTSDLATAYAMACFVSISVALSLRKAADKALAGKTGLGVALAGNMIGYTAVFCAGNSNVYLMRQAELEKGITLKDPQSGQEFGPSKVAASEAVWSTIYSRTAYIAPVFFLPVLLNKALEGMRLMPKPATPLRVIVESIGVGIGLWLAMPLNCSIYPQSPRPYE